MALFYQFSIFSVYFYSTTTVATSSAATIRHGSDDWLCSIAIVIGY